ncbi:hypothetical protein PIB30_059983, partial [Stylosanthes scabra]|nr:hypothetical protein [Stylosanthes scabra]
DGSTSTFDSLETFDLSHNNLDEGVLEFLFGLTSLKNLILAANNFVGLFPGEGSKFYHMVLQLGDMDSKTFEVQTENKDDSSIDFISFYLSFAVTSVTVLFALVTMFWIIPHWRRAWFHFIEGILLKCFAEFLK